MKLRKLLNLPSKSPKTKLYFLTGSTPIRFIIKRRRLVYLHHILIQSEESLIRSFFEQQFQTRKSKDWSTQIVKDLIELDIEMTFEEIRLIKEDSWKSLVKSKSTHYALKYLNSITGSKSRKYSELRMSGYLTSEYEDVPLETAKFILKIQSHMVETVKYNFQNYYKPNLLCNLCLLSECNQSHLLNCPKLLGSNQLVTYIPVYEDIFDDSNPEEQCYIANIMIENLKKKKALEKMM